MGAREMSTDVPNIDRAKLRTAKHMGSKQLNSANDKTNRLSVLERLTPDESGVVLRILLERNQNLRAEAEKIATELVASPSAEDIAEDIFEAVTSVDIDDLKDRNPVRNRLLADFSKYVPDWSDGLGREADRNVAIVMSQVEGQKTGARP